MSSPQIQLASPSLSEAIVDPLYRACQGIDTFNMSAFDSAWVTGGSSKHNGDEVAIFDFCGNIMNGLDTIRQNVVIDGVGPLDTLHFISNVRIVNKSSSSKGGGEIDRASFTAYAMANHFRKGTGLTPGAERLLSGATYQVDVQKDANDKDGLWKIKKWAMQLIWTEGNGEILSEPK